uniref:Uncharacterized protein n=1 Tax=Cyprinus carpio TaxID=7962 RepID=A0A8C2BT09_CYPCA
MSSETKLTMLEMKLSLIITCLIFFQSLVSSPSRRQIDSRASLTAAGGLAITRTSTRCCFLIELTAREGMEVWAPRVDRWNYLQKSVPIVFQVVFGEVSAVIIKSGKLQMWI